MTATQQLDLWSSKQEEEEVVEYREEAKAVSATAYTKATDGSKSKKKSKKSKKKRGKRKSEYEQDIDRLAVVLRDALIKAWILHNPVHDNPDFCAVRHTGSVGYRHVARELMRLGVCLPSSEEDEEEETE